MMEDVRVKLNPGLPWQKLHFTSFFLKFKSSVLVKRVFFLLNAAFAMANYYMSRKR
jgi:hypothetical protein